MTKGPGINRTPLPLGFTAGGVNSGVRKYRPDVGLIFSDRDCVAAGVFTQNECKAAPVLYSQALVPSAKIRAIVTNSGQANAATGEEGERQRLVLLHDVERLQRVLHRLQLQRDHAPEEVHHHVDEDHVVADDGQVLGDLHVRTKE